MCRNIYSLIFLLLFSFLFITNSQAQQYSDNFDTYTAGQLLACQNPTDWTTWSNAPCGAEDANVSNAQSFSPPNSVVFTFNDDVVRLHGGVNTGKWYTSFRMFIPTGKAGYFNMLSDFTFGTGGYWVFECYFDVGGGGRFLTGDPLTNFTWTPNTWIWVEVIIDLGTNQAEFWMGGSLSGGTLVKSWAWTNGTSAGTGPLVIAATDFFGATAGDEMYVDDFWFGPFSVTPVELTSFTASVNPLGEAVLNWVTATEINNRGFEIERRAVDGQFLTVGFVEGYGTTSEEQTYSFVDKSVTPGSFVYRLKQIDFNGQFEYSPEVELDVTSPLEFTLDQNFPNPFNPNTNIKYSLSESGFVKLAVYNTLGEELQVLVSSYKEAGHYNVNFNAANLPSGTYIYRLEAPGYVEAKKMILMK